MLLNYEQGIQRPMAARPPGSPRIPVDPFLVLFLFIFKYFNQLKTIVFKMKTNALKRMKKAALFKDIRDKRGEQ